MSKTKGNRTQRKAIELLEQAGWEVGKCELGGKFAKERDLFGLFDLVALKKDELPRFIQVKTNKPMTQKPLKDFSKKYDNIICVCLTWYDRDGWREQIYFKGKLYENDYRKSKKG